MIASSPRHALTKPDHYKSFININSFMKKLLIFFLTALLAFGVGWAETATLTNANIVNAGTAKTGYQSWAISDGNGNTWNAYAIKNQHSNATSSYHYLQIRKYGSNTAYYIQVPQFGTKITKIVMTVSGSSQAMGGGGNSAALYFSSSNSTSATGTGVASGTGASSVTIDCSSLNLNTGYITASAAVRIWDITVTYESGSTPPEPIIYKKVTSSTDLVADKKYIIVNEANGVGMGALTSTQYGSSISGLTFEGGKVDIAGKDVMEMTLGGTSNAWTFNMGGTAPYLAVSGSTTDNAFLAAQSVQGRTNDITKWTITASSSSCIIQNNNVTTRSIRYSPSGSIFLTSTSSPNTYPYASLYVKYEGKVETPAFSIAAGTYVGTQNVSISCATSGATIYYTIDGSTPTTLSTAYTGPIEVAQDMTIKAIAVAPAMDDSDVNEAAYTIKAAPATTVYEKITSTDDLTDGNYLIVYEGGDLVFDGSRTTLDAVGNTQGVTISNHQIETSDAIYFTYDATAKTLKSASGYYIGQTKNDNGLASNENTSYQNTISFETDGNANIVSGGAYLRYNSSSNQLRFRYYKSSSYTAQQAIQLYKEVGTPKVKTPTFSVAEGTYTSAQVVEISCATSGATIYYTTDGSTPTTSSTPYSGAITVDHDMTIKAIAVATGYDDSDVATATYNIDLTPTMTVAPTELSFGSIDGGQLTVTTSNLSAGVNASVLNTNYNANTDKWTVTPSTLGTEGGSMTVNYGGRLLKSDNTVRVSSNGVADVDVPVHYKHSDPIYIVTNANNWDFNSGAQMNRNGDTYSYTLNATADTYLVFTKKVGSDVNWNTNYLFGPVSSGDWWLTEESVDTDFDLDSTAYHVVKMHHGTYTITLNAATNQMRIVADVHAPEFSVEGGIVSGTQNVEITCDTEGAHIYYTTDGTTPSATNGTLYTGPVTISESTTLKAVAIFGNITSPVTTANYVITPAFVQKDYEMVTNINDLVPGQTYLLVYKTSDTATEAHVMGKINSSGSYDYANQEQTSESSAGLITSTSAMAPVTLLQDDNSWTLLTSEGILAYPDDGKNSLTAGSASYTWTITKVDDTNTFAIKSNSVDRYLLYNNNSSSLRFACYGSASNQIKYVYIYRESSTPAILANPSNVAIELATGVAQGSNTFTVGGRNLTEGVTLTLSAEDQAKGFSLWTTSISQQDALAGNVEVTVTYNGNAASETATITLSSAGANDVTVTVNATREPLTVTITPADGATFVGQIMSDQVTISSNVANATIEYSTDGGQTWQPYSDGFNVSVATVGGTVTVMARATITDGSYSETATAQATYTRQPRGETLYEKVTSEDQIKAGEKYILVYEGSTPVAFNGIYTGNNVSWGSGVNVAWKTQNQIVDIANTDATIFTLGGTKDNWTLQATQGYLESTSSSGSGIKFYNETTSGYQWETPGGDDGYYLTWSNYTLRYNTDIADRGPFRLYNNSTGVPAYLYVLRPAVMTPVITPATGTYYENEQVTISSEAGTTVYYTTDGSDPTISSTPYQGPFTVNYVDGGTTTIKAVAVDDEGNVSTIATVTYTWGKPSVAINPDSRNVTTESVNVTLTSTPAGAAIYYTTDGNTPTTASEQYSGAFSVSLPSVGDVANVKAIAVYNGLTSEVASATYTRVEKVVEVKDPFFSPIENHVYYGDQEIEILCASNNADIYYEMATVAGDVAPDASSVATPTRSSSTSYDEPITMTAGNSYYVKAIAYIGNYTSKVIEGWFTIKSTSEWSTPTDATTVLENVAELRRTASGSRVTFRNPIQVVYMSTMANDPTPGSYSNPIPEYVYVRDNSGYGVIYFGKGATMWAKETSGRRNSPATIFKMGDWIDGSEICGTTGTWEDGLIPQVGTGAHTIYSWPSNRLGNTPIMPEEATCADVRNANETSNLCGHYLHLRNTTLNGVDDYNAAGGDYRHSGTISDNSGACTYYDRFWLYSGTTSDNISFTYSNTYYTMSGLGHYDQNWFNSKGEDATFDVFCVGDYYSKIPNPYEVYPIDFLWTYKPVITVTPGETVTDQVDTYAVAQTVTISATQPEWAAEDVVIYYKTDEMDDWAEYTGPFVVSSTTSVQTYAEVYAKKNDAAQTDYNDYVRSVTVSQDFYFVGIEDPEIAPESRVIEIVNGNETVEVLIDANNGNNSNVITVYTTDGSMPSATNGTPIAAGDIIELDPITETTTITAISYLPDANGNPVLWSNAVTETYTFVKKNGVIYDLLTTAPTVGNVYVIVNKDAYMGMSTKQNENNRGSVGVMFTDNTKAKVYGNDELALFVLEKADGNRYYFKNINGNGYLTVAGNAGLQTGEADYYASAGVEIGSQADGYPATITFRGDKVRTMRYSANSRTFSTYTDAALNQDVFLYGVNATPLRYIEDEMKAGTEDNPVQVTVSDELIGTWAVKNLLWAKDQGYANVKTFAEDGQQDYVKDILKYQRNEGWDQSNWVILDFTEAAGGAEMADEFVGKKIEMASVTGDYVDDVNYTIRLKQAPALAKDDSGNAIDVSADYPGYTGPIDGVNNNPQAAPTGSYTYAYNTYVPANFLNSNLNLDGNEGFVAQEGAAAPSHVGEQLFFVNPKVMEVARIWAVYAGTGEDGKDIFTVYEPDQQNVNGWGVEGAFSVEWDYNRLVASDPNLLGRPQGIADKKNEAFLFHAVVASNTAIANAPLRAAAAPQGQADTNPSMSSSYRLYPLDFPSDGTNYTAVSEVRGVKTVESVRYYNIMGMESEKPFEGINIVVTRYSDGTTSTAKVLR